MSYPFEPRLRIPSTWAFRGKMSCYTPPYSQSDGEHDGEHDGETQEAPPPHPPPNKGKKRGRPPKTKAAADAGPSEVPGKADAGGRSKTTTAAGKRRAVGAPAPALAPVAKDYLHGADRPRSTKTILADMMAIRNNKDALRELEMEEAELISKLAQVRAFKQALHALQNIPLPEVTAAPAAHG